jgi:very-short-patch-repair endonuclease
MHGTRWLPTDAPAELARVRKSAPPGIVIHCGSLANDETCLLANIPCTTAPRTAYDIGRRVPYDTGIIRIDALFNATRCSAADVERIAARYPGARGLRRLRASLALADGGAESPQETRVRLLLVRAALPPVTQIWVGRRRIDMGYPEFKVGVEYEGEQHWNNPRQYEEDIARLEYLAAQGWIIVRVSARQLRYDREGIVRRVRAALARRDAGI